MDKERRNENTKFHRPMDSRKAQLSVDSKPPYPIQIRSVFSLFATSSSWNRSLILDSLLSTLLWMPDPFDSFLWRLFLVLFFVVGIYFCDCLFVALPDSMIAIRYIWWFRAFLLHLIKKEYDKIYILNTSTIHKF